MKKDRHVRWLALATAAVLSGGANAQGFCLQKDGNYSRAYYDYPYPLFSFKPSRQLYTAPRYSSLTTSTYYSPGYADDTTEPQDVLNDHGGSRR